MDNADDTPSRHADPSRRSDVNPAPPSSDGRSLDRRIFALAWPALGALVAEPLFVLVDSAVVGRLGTAQLAGLTIASTVLVTLVAVFVFLAYATTAAVARKIGAGDQRGALAHGVDGIWLALVLGLVLVVLALTLAPHVVTALGASAQVTPYAVAYLRWSAPGIPGMLVVLAATGALRGMQDTRTPFVVAVAGAVLNAVLCVALVYGAGMGIAGSGLATAIAQLGMGAVLLARIVSGARTHDVPLRPHLAGILANLRAGIPLFIRTLTLRGAIMLTVVVATGLGEVTVAAHQIVYSIWILVAFVLDALAIAAQALVGHDLGARDIDGVRALTRRTLRWGTLGGAAIGVVVAGSGWLIAPVFTADPDVRHAAALALVVTGLLMPVAGWVFVLDGVLMGAGDGRYLAVAGVLTLLAYLPLLLAVRAWAPDGVAGLAWLWVAFAGGFMLARAITTGQRVRGTRWMLVGG